MAGDLYEPKLRVRASGLGGSGYAIPTRPDPKGKPLVVPGATTVTGVEEKGGVVQWAVDNTAAYAAALGSRLLDHSEERAYNMLRWYHTRRPKVDDPTLNVNDYSQGVLDDLAEFGTDIHSYINESVNGLPNLRTPPTERHAQAYEAFEIWASEHVIEPVVSEITVFSPEYGYAGTLDHIWYVDYEPVLIDVKTSRNIGTSHLKQLSCLGAADVWMREMPGGEGTPHKTSKWGTTYWQEDVVPSFVKYAILQVRPGDVDNKGKYVPPFAKLHYIDNSIIDASFPGFLGALEIRKSNAAVKKIVTSLDLNYRV